MAVTERGQHRRTFMLCCMVVFVVLMCFFGVVFFAELRLKWTPTLILIP